MKKSLILLIMCVIALLVYEIISIYAVFYSEVGAKVNLQNGVWNISVNGTQITKGVDTQFVIDEISTTENDYVKPGRLAPGLSGSFELAINPEDTNVAVRYDVTLNQEELGNSNLNIKSIKEVEQGYELIKTAVNTYTGIISLEQINNGAIHKMKVDVEWVDDNNDESDTELGMDESHQLKIPISVHVIQYLGEEILPIEEVVNQEI